MDKLFRLLDQIENMIDVEHVKKVEKLHVKALSYDDVDIIPIVITPESIIEEMCPYKEAYDDPAKMLYNELLLSCGGSIKSSVMVKDHLPYNIRSNYGIGIIASLFGAVSKVVGNNMPWVDHIESKKELYRMIGKGVPAFDTALGRKVTDTYSYFNSILKNYPKCKEVIRVTQPDMQGPFDIAHLLIGSDIFYDIYDDPEMIHSLLDLITETYIGFRNYIDKYLNDITTDKRAMYIHGGIYMGRVLLKDDTALINLSPEQYREFIYPYNKRIIDMFKGSLHYCGKLSAGYDDMSFEIRNNENLGSVHYGNPEMQDLSKIIELNQKTKCGIALWGFNQKYEFLEGVFDHNIKTGLTLTCYVNDINTAVSKLDEYKKFMDKYLRS